MRNIVLLVGSFVLLAAGLDSVLADCQHSLPLDPIVRPDLFYPFGKWFLKYRVIGDSLRLRESERVHVRCATGFEDPTVEQYSSNHSVVLFCQYNYFYVESKSMGLHQIYSTPKCKGPKWSLLETETNRECHSPGSTTFVMAISNWQENNVLGTLCYDMESMIVKRLQYVLQKDTRRNKEVLLLPPMNITVTPEDTEIKDFLTGFNMMYKTPSNDYVADRSQENWLKLANYQSLSIVQLGYQAAYFNKYAPLTNIFWWPNLLYGNWQLYTDALSKHLPRVSGGYRVYVGVEGSVKSLTKSKCSQSQRPELLITEQQRSIPLYVWNYLKANDNSEEIVIIGYNSPFFEFQPSDEAIFCQDICHDVAWLKNSTDTFRYTTMGVIFCCRPEDVLKSGKLPDFPQEKRNPLLLNVEENTIQGASDSEVTTGTVDPGSV